MGLYHSPRITTDGLSLCFDAGNIKSYPGSGTTWNDISGNGYGNSLVGGANVTFVEDAGGALDFDTTLITDIGYISTSSFTHADGAAGTWEWWVKWHSGGRTGLNSLAGLGTTNPWMIWQVNSATSWYFRFRDASATYNAFTTITTLDATNWTHIVATIDSSETMRNYINGQFTSSLDLSLLSTAFNMARIAGGYSSGGNEYNLDGQMGSFRYYDRDLSATEVSQNFNAMRTRYGVSKVGY